MKLNKISCAFCPESKGVIVQATFEKSIGKHDEHNEPYEGHQKKKDWAHSVCINLISGVWFTNKYRNVAQGLFNGPLDIIFKNDIHNVQRILNRKVLYKSALKEDECTYCERKEKSVALLKCDYQHCKRLNCHVLCAKKNCLIDDWEIMDKRNRNIYCEAHFKHHLDKNPIKRRNE